MLELMRTRRRLTPRPTPRQAHALENEYYWFSQQPRKQYQLGLRGIHRKVPGAGYSCGVGAAMIALECGRKGDTAARNRWAKKALSAWKSYHRKYGERFSSVIYEAVAWGAAGELAMMEKRLRRCADLAKVPLRNHSLQWAGREVSLALNSQ